MIITARAVSRHDGGARQAGHAFPMLTLLALTMLPSRQDELQATELKAADTSGNKT